MSTQPRSGISKLQDIPNIGPAMAKDLLRLGISQPQALIGQDPYELYETLCKLTMERHDPCVLDTLIAAVKYMEGAPKKPWWHYTQERKQSLAERDKA